ncbi:MAG: helix-turn-helix domain-containing protein [Myxococcota bacterium]
MKFTAPHPDIVAATRTLSVPDVLVVEDLALHLRRSPSAVRTLLREGKLPGRKVGRRWVTLRRDLLDQLSTDRPFSVLAGGAL